MSPIARLSGTVSQLGPDWLILEVGGIGFKVSVPISTLAGFTRAGEKAALHTHLHVREDELSLYGFSSQEDLETFELLISVSGVGPRLALALLSAMAGPELIAAIAQEEASILTRVPGVGRRLADRIVLELKDKLKEYAFAAMRPDAGPGSADVIGALIALGYSRAEAEAAVSSSSLPADSPLEERVRRALQALAQR